MKKLYTLTSTAIAENPSQNQNNSNTSLKPVLPKLSTLALIRQFARAYTPVASFPGIVLN